MKQLLYRLKTKITVKQIAKLFFRLNRTNKENVYYIIKRIDKFQ